MKKKIALVFLFWTICTTTHGQAIVQEESIKAAFIFHFINFSEWDDDATDYNVCIPEDETLRRAANDSLKDKMVDGRKILVVDKADTCHVLVSDSVPSTENMLTIGPLNKGALLEFRTINNKLKFAVNLENVKKSKIKISSQLLKLAILEGS